MIICGVLFIGIGRRKHPVGALHRSHVTRAGRSAVRTQCRGHFRIYVYCRQDVLPTLAKFYSTGSKAELQAPTGRMWIPTSLSLPCSIRPSSLTFRSAASFSIASRCSWGNSNVNGSRGSPPCMCVSRFRDGVRIVRLRRASHTGSRAHEL